MEKLDGFTTEQFTFEGATRTVYRAGSGPAIVVMHEIPGIIPAVYKFAKRLADAGFSVYLPHLFGTPMKPFSVGYSLCEVAKACVSKEFRVFASHESSPIVDWLRALAAKAYKEQGGRGVGAIGMCITGNFALTMMLDEFLLAPVLSQPSLPFPISKDRGSELHISDENLKVVRERVKNGAKILGLRFHGDTFCPGERFDRLKKEFGDGFEAIELDPKFANPNGKKPPHSILTTELIDQEGQPTRKALDRVIQFFKEQLLQ